MDCVSGVGFLPLTKKERKRKGFFGQVVTLLIITNPMDLIVFRWLDAGALLYRELQRICIEKKGKTFLKEHPSQEQHRVRLLSSFMKKFLVKHTFSGTRLAVYQNSSHETQILNLLYSVSLVLIAEDLPLKSLEKTSLKQPMNLLKQISVPGLKLV